MLDLCLQFDLYFILIYTTLFGTYCLTAVCQKSFNPVTLGGEEENAITKIPLPNMFFEKNLRFLVVFLHIYIYIYMKENTQIHFNTTVEIFWNI